MDVEIRNRLWKFADDAKLLGGVGTREGIKSIEDDLKELTSWANNKWQIAFNADKCKVMRIEKTNVRRNYVMEGVGLGEF